MEISSRKDVGAQLIVRHNGIAILIMTCHNAANFHEETLLKNLDAFVAMAAKLILPFWKGKKVVHCETL
jgi:hypothetical protein